MDPNLLIQRPPFPSPPVQAAPGGMTSGPGFGAPMGAMPGGIMPSGVAPQPQRLPTEFDQDQAWANSPWVPQPSKELTELKQTVDALRKELGEMKETVKALETQIQLLNRNILLSQPVKQP